MATEKQIEAEATRLEEQPQDGQLWDGITHVEALEEAKRLALEVNTEMRNPLMETKLCRQKTQVAILWALIALAEKEG